MKRALLIPICVLLGVRLSAQVDSAAQVMEEEWVDEEEEIVEENDWVEYVGGFDFREGVYRTWREFRLNAPSLPLASLVDSEGQPIKDLRDFDGRIFLRDTTGEQSRVPMGRVWGYCADDAVFMDTRNGFQRILRMGSACHMMVQEWEVGGGAIVRGAPVLIERILNMRTGSFKVFNSSSLAEVLHDDQKLYYEFISIAPRKRNRPEVLHQFLMRYNQRNPLRFPPS